MIKSNSKIDGNITNADLVNGHNVGSDVPEGINFDDYEVHLANKAIHLSSSDRAKLDNWAVDTELSATSTNPVENKVITKYLSGLSVEDHVHSLADIKDITASADEVNRLSGVTSNIQSQLNTKAPLSHTHNYVPLSASVLQNVDFDSLINAGQYNVSSSTNAPSDTETNYYLSVLRLSEDYVRQLCYSTSDASKSYTRIKTSGTWSEWTPLGTTESSTVNGHTVEADVPADAKFTDTTYTLTQSNGIITLTSSTGLSSKAQPMIYYAENSETRNIVARAITMPSVFQLKAGVIMMIKFTNTSTAESAPSSSSYITLNVNNTGAKNIYDQHGSKLTGANYDLFYNNKSVLLVYNGTDFIYIRDTNNTYSPQSLGIGYGTCSTSESTLTKAALLPGYQLVSGGIVSVKFTNNVPANSALNINSQGSYPIYYRGSVITDGVISAGDTATFVYSDSTYKLISIDGSSGSSDYELPIASSTTLGGVTTTSTVSSSSGYTACPIIEGVPYYQNTDTNTLPYQYNTTADGEYRLLLSYQANDNSYREDYLKKSSKFTANPSTGALTATTFNGNLNGTVNGYSINKSVPSDAVFTDTVLTVDSAMSSTSTNPVQNKVIYSALNGKSSTSHTHSYAGSSSAGGSATSAVKLDSSAGSATKPVYFSDGKPVACNYTLGKSVPSDAVFTDTVYTLPTASSSTLGGVKTTSTVSSSSGYTACPIISGVPYYKDTNTTYTLSSFGITATSTELNYCEGVTSNIQTQLDAKASSSHSHSYLPLSGGSMTGTISNSNAYGLKMTSTNSHSYTFPISGTDSSDNPTFRVAYGKSNKALMLQSFYNSSVYGYLNIISSSSSTSGKYLRTDCQVQTTNQSTIDTYMMRNIAAGTSSTPVSNSTYGGAGAIYLQYTS